MTGRAFARPLDAVDAVEAEADGEGLIIHVEKTVRATDPYMAGHFPGFTLYPAIFLLETVRQSVGSVLRDHDRLGAHVWGGRRDDWLEIRSLRSVRVLKPMLEGDLLCLRIGVRIADTPGAVRAVVRCTRGGGPVVAEATMQLVRGGTTG